MKISAVNNNIKSFHFGAARVAINAFSDSHGDLENANNALEELRDRQKDLFFRDEKGSCNVLAVCGDWFMNGAKKGYVSAPEKPLALFQLEIFNAFTNQIKQIASNTVSLFTPGNHEFDCGVPLLDEVLSKIDADVIMTNLDIENSSGFSRSISGNKIINEKILEIEDDKNPDLKHKILFLGVSPVNMRGYQRNLSGIKLKNNVDLPQKYVTKSDYEETYEDCKSRIKRFKAKNPNGLVVLLSHTGVQFADNLAQESMVDLVFDGHEHRETIRHVNRVPIVPLSQNFKKVANAKITFDDSGKPKGIEIFEFSPLQNDKKGPLLELYNKLFNKDLAKIYTISSQTGESGELSIDNVRRTNNFLANFVTDSVLEEIRKTNPEVDFFALNSSSIRHPLKLSNTPQISQFDILNVLSGIREDEAKIMTTKISGKDLAYMVLDNFIFNSDNPDQNTLIHYSGLIIDKTSMMEAYSKMAPLESMVQYIIDARTNKPIQIDKEYTIANTEKYFDKSRNGEIKAKKQDSVYIGKTVQELFGQHFKNSNGKLIAKCDVRIK